MIAPQLPYYPTESINLLKNIIQDISKTQIPLIISSSMGCFFVNHIAQSQKLKACFINPAVDPFDRVAEYLDKDIVHPYTKEIFHLTKKNFSDLQKLKEDQASPLADYRIYLKTGDEVLNYKLAEEMYQSHFLHIDKGGDHSFSDFEDYLDEMTFWLLT